MSQAEPSFFFYDLETSGFNPREARVMQFAGQRTNLSLEPVGEPINKLITMSPDVLPEPDAVLVTGITPQQTILDGISESEFLRLFYQQALKPNTTFLGYNSIRFDDEFMRYLLYRNFYDSYEWQWKEGCSRWDLLDVVRMTRALRPKGIEWPFASDGKPANRLELLTSVNKLSHEHAHDALSDVHATIAIAKLIKDKQPDLFDYLFSHRKKDAVKNIVDSGKPFVYASGRYSSQWQHASVAVKLMSHPGQDAALVYDLRHDPAEFVSKTAAQLVEHWHFSKDPNHVRLPVKTLKYNRCPAVAPLGVWNDEAQARLELSVDTIKHHLATLKEHQREFSASIAAAVELMDAERSSQTQLVTDQQTVDSQLYDGFFGQRDKTDMALVRATIPDELSDLKLEGDKRLQQLLPLYKARNFADSLTSAEHEAWESFCQQRLQAGGASSRLQKFAKRLQQSAEDTKLTDKKRFLLEELQLYAEAIVQYDPGLSDAA